MNKHAERTTNAAQTKWLKEDMHPRSQKEKQKTTRQQQRDTYIHKETQT